MKDFSNLDALEVIDACFNLLALRESEIRNLYDRLQKYEPLPNLDSHPPTQTTPQIAPTTSPSYPGALAVCGTPIVGRSLMLLCPQMGLRLLGITNSGLEALSLIEKLKPDFAFVDLDISDIDGLVLISRMKDLAPNLNILALSPTLTETVLVSAVIAGARDVLAKPIQAARVMDIVKRIQKQKNSDPIPSGKLPLRIDPSLSINFEPNPNPDGWSVIHGSNDL